MRHIVQVCTVGALLLLFIDAAQSPLDRRVEENLRRSYPEARQVTKEFVYLTRQQAEQVKARSGLRPDTRLYTFYVAAGDHEKLAYAAVDTHVLRTHHETLMIVITPMGRVRQVEILAFQEPPDYRPTDRWLELFHGRTLDPDLRIGRAIPNISGATITATTIVRRIRLILAVWNTVYGVKP